MLKLCCVNRGTKIKWILDHIEGSRAGTEKGELLFVRRMGELLFDIRAVLQWKDPILQLMADHSKSI
jgi:hypothetical protein